MRSGRKRDKSGEMRCGYRGIKSERIGGYSGNSCLRSGGDRATAAAAMAAIAVAAAMAAIAAAAAAAILALVALLTLNLCTNTSTVRFQTSDPTADASTTF